MENRIYLWDLYDYEAESEKSKRAISKNPYFDLEQIASKKIQQEIADFIRYRSTEVGCAALNGTITQFNRACRFLKEYSTEKSSLSDKKKEVWLRQLKRWMMREGIALTVNSIQIYGQPYRFKSRLLAFFEKLLDFTLKDERDEQDEIEKDIWEIDKLDIHCRENPIRKCRTVNFTKIYQDEMREEIKKGIYLNLQNESIDCILKELTSMRKLSKYLLDKHPNIKSCKDVSRELIEEYLTYLKTEHGENRCLRTNINRMRKLLESVGQICGYPNLLNLFLTRDIPPTLKAEFKIYSDSELKRLNAAIVKMNEQDARLLVIHQMLGTRISDALLLETDCLYKQNGEHIIRINQMKTRTYEKPISEEVVALIQKAISYTKEHYGDTQYIFVNQKNPTQPMQYATLQLRVVKMIREKDLRDDNGELFGFGTHMFRHCYGAKLTEMHLDDWTIAKLLGHKGVGSVKHYRRMSNQLLADETRQARKCLSDIILNNLDGWEAEYEQVRQDACIE